MSTLAYDMSAGATEDVKVDLEHAEKASLDGISRDAPGTAAPQSAFAGLPPWKAIMKFRRLFCMGLLTCVGAM